MSKPTLSLKRGAPSPELSDSENIDPSVFEASCKRKRGCIEDDISRAKSIWSNGCATPANAKPYLSRSGAVTIVTPQTSAAIDVSRVPPVSAPAAAGRSPSRSMGKPVSRRRFAPPMIRGVTSPALSLSAALKGTLAHKKARPVAAKRAASLEDAKPKAWFFDVFVETEEYQEYKMNEWTMTQSSAALDLSDVQDRSLSSNVEHVKVVADDESKENVDPNAALGVSAPGIVASNPTVTTVEVKPSSSEGSRTPLGDLNAADYYADGLNATSVVLVQDEVEHHSHEDGVADDAGKLASQSMPAAKFTLYASSTTDNVAEHEMKEEVPAWAQRSSTALTQMQVGKLLDARESATVPADIEIWESESAKDENEGEEGENLSSSIVVEAGETVCVSAFVLQEL